MQMGEDQADVTAAEVLANVGAMTYAIQSPREKNEITPDVLLETHRRLLAPTPLASHGGQIRTTQNWIGGSNDSPCSAVFVPPPPEFVQNLLSDLCDFCNADSLPAVAQAAIAHAQFETIHPFTDGNGRVSRALIHVILRRRGLTRTVTPPVSLALATRARDYIEGLSATRYDGAPDSREAAAGLNRWLGTFAAACTRATQDAASFEDRIREIQEAWRRRLGRTRADAAALKLIVTLPGTPVTTLAAAAKTIGRSLPSTMEGLKRLVDAGIVSPLYVARKRRQIFEAREVIAAFTSLERQLASPPGDTRIEPPARPVPARRITR